MDKEKIHIDEEFLNQSWANMSTILDKEMPVKKRKRRFAWLWLSGLLVLTLVVFAYLNNPFNEEKVIVPINNKKTIESEKPKTKIVDHQLIDLKKESVQKTPISTSTKSTDTPNSVNVINAIKNLTLANPSESTKSIIDSEAGIFVDGSRLPIKTNRPDNSLNKSTRNLNRSIENKSKLNIENTLNNQKFTANFSPIPTLNFSPFYNQDLSLSFPTFPLKNKGSWHLGIYAGKTFPKLGSFRSGLHVQKVFNRKWAIYFGLGYARRVTKISSNGDQALNADASSNNLPIGIPEMEDTLTGPSTNQDPFGTTFDPEFTATTSIAYQNFHYFEFPILVQYQLHRRWSLELGGQLSRLYGYRYTNLSDGSSTFTTDLSFSTLDMVRSSGSINSDIATWDFAALGGTAFQLSPRFHIYSTYRIGLNNYLNNATDPTNQKKWRQIEFGVRYYFK